MQTRKIPVFENFPTVVKVVCFKLNTSLGFVFGIAAVKVSKDSKEATYDRVLVLKKDSAMDVFCSVFC